MGNTPINLLPYPELSEPADVPADIRELALALDPLLRPQLVSALPASPPDGTEVHYLANAAAGVVWHLRYRAAATGAYKWEFVGGSGLQAYIATAGTTSSAAYTDLATPGPTVTLPLAGEYEVQHAATMGATAASQTAYQSYAIGAAAAADSEQVIQGNPAGLTTGNFFSLSSAVRRHTVAAGTALTCKYRSSSGVSTFQARSLRAVPVRVG